MVTDGALTNRI